MKKLFVSALAMLAVALGFTACSSDEEFAESPAQGQKVTICATTEEPAAQRTALGEQGQVLWSEGDKINVGGNVFTLTSGAGTTNGTFDGIASLKDKFYNVYYPVTYNGTAATWPTAQTYVENNIPQGVPMNAQVLVLKGQVFPATKLGGPDDGVNASSIKFYNVGGILRLNLKGEAKVTSIKISANELDVITLDCGDGVQLNTTTATPFHIAVPGSDEGTNYSNLKIEIKDDAGKVCVKSLKSGKTIIVQRSMITDINLTVGSFDYACVILAGYKWATENLGAVKGITPNATEEIYGYYYTQSDAIRAAASLGGKWALPTEEQWKALKDNCIWTWQESYSFGGKTMNGYLVSDKKDASKFIFLPAAGVYSVGRSNALFLGYYGYYWSADNGKCLYFYNGLRNINTNNTNYGLAVRPVSSL